MKPNDDQDPSTANTISAAAVIVSLTAAAIEVACVTAESAAAKDPVSGVVERNDMTAYEYMGLPTSATAAVIRKAFLKLSVRWHPDKNPNSVQKATRVFKKLNEAYDILRDENIRQQHIDSCIDSCRSSSSSNNGSVNSKMILSSNSSSHSSPLTFLDTDRFA